MGRKAVVLLSGGLDSTTCLCMAQREGYDVCALTLRYGQRHVQELDAARLVAQRAGVVEHLILDLDLTRMGGSALTASIPVPKAGLSGAIPVTYVPARNTIFLSLALGWAETLSAHDIYIGVNAVDFSGYPDCRPEFITAFERLASLATREGVEGRGFRIHAPLLHLSKREIVLKALELGLDLSLTRSCYDPNHAGEACGLCDACRLRLEGFSAAGVKDPLAYQTSDYP